MQRSLHKHQEKQVEIAKIKEQISKGERELESEILKLRQNKDREANKHQSELEKFERDLHEIERENHTHEEELRRFHQELTDSLNSTDKNPAHKKTSFF
jgi:predicted  nucleic acid-binding Zn-ribbon protein